MKDVITTVQVESWQSRTFTNSDGEEKIVRSGDVMDPSGRCRLTAWCEIDLSSGTWPRALGLDHCVLDPNGGSLLHPPGNRSSFATSRY